MCRKGGLSKQVSTTTSHTMDSDLFPFFQSIAAGTRSRTTKQGSPDFPVARLLDGMENSPARAEDDQVPRSPPQRTQCRVEPANENAGRSAKMRPLVFASLHCSVRTPCTISVVGSHSRDNVRLLEGSVPRSRSGASSARSLVEHGWSLPWWCWAALAFARPPSRGSP